MKTIYRHGQQHAFRLACPDVRMSSLKIPRSNIGSLHRYNAPGQKNVMPVSTYVLHAFSTSYIASA